MSSIYFPSTIDDEIGKVIDGVSTDITLSDSNFTGWGLYALDENTLFKAGYYSGPFKPQVFYSTNGGSSWGHLGSQSQLETLIGARTIDSVWAFAVDDVYATAGWAFSSPTDSYVLHYNGTAWSIVHSVGGEYWRARGSVHVVSPTEVYLIGWSDGINFANCLAKFNGTALVGSTGSGLPTSAYDFAIDPSGNFWVHGQTDIYQASSFDGAYSVSYDLSANNVNCAWNVADMISADHAGNIYAAACDQVTYNIKYLKYDGSWSIKQIGSDTAPAARVYACQTLPACRSNTDVGLGIIGEHLGVLNTRLYLHDGASGYVQVDPSLSNKNMRILFEIPETPDVTGPTVTNKTPAPGSSGKSKDALISFSINDDVATEQSTIDSTVKGENAIVNGVFQAGYDGPSSSITANGSNGYDVVIDRTSSFDSLESVVATVYAEDSSGNPVNDSWSFTVADYEGVLVTPIDPVNGDVGVSLESDITLTLSDDDSVVASSITVDINRNGTWYSALVNADVEPFKYPYNGPGSSITLNAGVYTVVIDPVNAFGGLETIQIRVNALDPSGNPVRLA